jgi:site-specific DNA-methyltransferase (adenine-specific)
MTDFQLYNDDCLGVMDNIPDGSVDMVLCDLPYGTTQCKWDVIIPFDLLWNQYKRVCKKNAAILLFGSQPFTTIAISSNLKMFKYEIIWEKNNITNPMFSKKGILKAHENIMVFYDKHPTYNPQMEYGYKNYKQFSGDKNIGDIYGDSLKSQHRECSDGSRYPKSVLRFQKETKCVHPTQKPVALLEYLIRTFTNEDDIVLDNTMGSGSTGVACMNTNRNFIGIEKDEKYFVIAEKRIKEANIKLF